MHQVVDPLLIVALTLNFVALGVSRIRAVINALRLQGILLGVLPLFVHPALNRSIIVKHNVRAGEEDPPCETCGGILKSATISFGQPLDPAVISRAMRAAERADLLLAIGTSLQVYPIAGAVPLAKAAGARVVIVNAEPTPFDDIADAVLREPIGVVLPRIVS